jgi:hypothetical protein
MKPTLIVTAVLCLAFLVAHPQSSAAQSPQYQFTTFADPSVATFDTFARGINNDGEIVGDLCHISGCDCSGCHAFLRSHDGSGYIHFDFGPGTDVLALRNQ